MIHKKIVCYGLALFSALSLGAIEKDALVVQKYDGKQIAFASTDRPKVEFSDAEMIVSSASLTITFMKKEVRRFIFQKVEFPDALFPIEEDSALNDLLIAQEGDDLVLDGLADDEEVLVVRIDGLPVSVVPVQMERTVRIPLSSLPIGTYVVKCGTLFYKFQKR